MVGLEVVVEVVVTALAVVGGVVVLVVVVLVVVVLVVGGSQLYPAEGPFCWQHVLQQTAPFLEQLAADRPVHQSAWSPYGQSGPNHGVSNAGHASQHFVPTEEYWLHKAPVTFAHTTGEFEKSWAVESPNGQFSKIMW